MKPWFKLGLEVESTGFATQESEETDVIGFEDRNDYDSNTEVFRSCLRNFPGKYKKLKMKSGLVEPLMSKI